MSNVSIKTTAQTPHSASGSGSLKRYDVFYSFSKTFLLTDGSFLVEEGMILQNQGTIHLQQTTILQKEEPVHL